MNQPTKTLKTRVDIGGSECLSEEAEYQEEELEKLMAEVEQMAEKIIEYRSTLRDQFKNTFTLCLSAQRPALPGIEPGSEPGPSGEHQLNQGSFTYLA